VILALGGIAWNATLDELKRQGLWSSKRPAFGHGCELNIQVDQSQRPRRTQQTRLTLLASYHPSQQNTFTGRLTEEMFDEIFERVQRYLLTSRVSQFGLD
jgi:uracil-DNA glycosylase